jgi:hypothetical protein
MKKPAFFRGKYIEVWQYPDGDIIPGQRHFPALTTYDRLGELDQGAIIDNKRLGRAWK